MLVGVEVLGDDDPRGEQEGQVAQHRPAPGEQIGDLCGIARADDGRDDPARGVEGQGELAGSSGQSDGNSADRRHGQAGSGEPADRAANEEDLDVDGGGADDEDKGGRQEKAGKSTALEKGGTDGQADHG